MMNAVPTVSNESKMYSVMADLKLSNQHRQMLHKHINAAIDEIEVSILANPTVEAFKTLLLRTLKIHGRDKAVCSFERKGFEHKENKEGRRVMTEVWIPMSHKIDIDEHDWRVSIVKGGTKVRVHLTEEAMTKQKEYWADIEKKHGNHRNIVFHE